MEKYIVIKGYPVSSGYMGWIGDRYMLFATESDYLEFMRG